MPIVRDPNAEVFQSEDEPAKTDRLPALPFQVAPSERMISEKADNLASLPVGGSFKLPLINPPQKSARDLERELEGSANPALDKKKRQRDYQKGQEQQKLSAGETKEEKEKREAQELVDKRAMAKWEMRFSSMYLNTRSTAKKMRILIKKKLFMHIGSVCIAIRRLKFEDKEEKKRLRQEAYTHDYRITSTEQGTAKVPSYFKSAQDELDDSFLMVEHK